MSRKYWLQISKSNCPAKNCPIEFKYFDKKKLDQKSFITENCFYKRNQQLVFNSVLITERIDLFDVVCKTLYTFYCRLFAVNYFFIPYREFNSCFISKCCCNCFVNYIFMINSL